MDHRTSMTQMSGIQFSFTIEFLQGNKKTMCCVLPTNLFLV